MLHNQQWQNIKENRNVNNTCEIEIEIETETETALLISANNAYKIAENCIQRKRKTEKKYYGKKKNEFKFFLLISINSFLHAAQWQFCNRCRLVFVFYSVFSCVLNRRRRRRRSL